MTASELDRGKTKITAVSNSRVKYARRLQRRRVREKEERCLLEGVRLVADAAGAGASFVLGFWEESVLRAPGGEELVRRLKANPPAGGLFEVNRQVMVELSDTETPQGLVVVAERPAADPRALLEAGGPGTLAVLDNVRDPGNVGTIIRSADASGAAGVIVLPGTADPWGPKALRASMGSAFHVPVLAAERVVLACGAARPAGGRTSDRAEPATGEEEPEAEEAGAASRTALAAKLPALLAGAGYRVLVADASAELSFWRAKLDGKVVLVLGSEAEGADPALWAGAERVSIPMLGAAESLNVAMAAAVLLYEAARQRQVI